MVCVEAVVILAAVCKFNVDGQQAVFYQLEIQQQAACAAVAVDEG